MKHLVEEVKLRGGETVISIQEWPAINNEDNGETKSEVVITNKVSTHVMYLAGLAQSKILASCFWIKDSIQSV
jgi:hypothetical protein